MDKTQQIIDDIFAYAKKKYNTTPDSPWRSHPENMVLRHADSNKWYALIMPVDRKKLTIGGKGTVWVANMRTDDLLYRDILVQQKGIMPAYHMASGYWITVLLDGTVDTDTIKGLLDTSFSATASAKKKAKIRPPKEWLIPANPKYYDVMHAFDDTDVINWKQGAGVKKGDTIYLYVAAPVSAIVFRCLVLESDIPYSFKNGNVNIKYLIRVKLLQRYEEDIFTFDILRDEYGVGAIRGPRGVPYSLSTALNGYSDQW